MVFDEGIGWRQAFNCSAPLGTGRFLPPNFGAHFLAVTLATPMFTGKKGFRDDHADWPGWLALLAAGRSPRLHWRYR